jgi:hypothetical protein
VTVEAVVAPLELRLLRLLLLLVKPLLVLAKLAAL